MSDLIFLSSDEEEMIVDHVPNHSMPELDPSEGEKLEDEDSSQDEFGRDFEFSGILVSSNADEFFHLFLFAFLCPLMVGCGHFLLKKRVKMERNLH
jgi:hypothetical protein